ncbi:UDP-glycosyltransferase 74E1-like [Fagus crenata]
MPWALDVARQLGLDGAPFFTQSGSVNAIYYHANRGAIKFPFEGPTASLPSMPPLGINDLPSFMSNTVLNWITSQWPVKTIGPTIPSIYLDKRLEDDKDYGLNLFKPDADACMKWLDKMETGSVVYAAFGSLAALGEEQMEEITWGLEE